MVQPTQDRTHHDLQVLWKSVLLCLLWWRHLWTQQWDTWSQGHMRSVCVVIVHSLQAFHHLCKTSLPLCVQSLHVHPHGRVPNLEITSQTEIRHVAALFAPRLNECACFAHQPLGPSALESLNI